MVFRQQLQPPQILTEHHPALGRVAEVGAAVLSFWYWDAGSGGSESTALFQWQHVGDPSARVQAELLPPRASSYVPVDARSGRSVTKPS